MHQNYILRTFLFPLCNINYLGFYAFVNMTPKALKNAFSKSCIQKKNYLKSLWYLGVFKQKTKKEKIRGVVFLHYRRKIISYNIKKIFLKIFFEHFPSYTAYCCLPISLSLPSFYCVSQKSLPVSSKPISPFSEHLKVCISATFPE